MNRYCKIIILSKKSEIYHLIKKNFGIEYEIIRPEKREFKKSKNRICTLLEGSIGLIIENESCFRENITLVRYVRMYGFSGFILFISKTKERSVQIEEKICAINSGVDEYLSNLQTEGEIAASVKALLRRFGSNEYLTLCVREELFQINPQTRKIYIDGNELALTKTEFDIVNYLVIHRNRVVSYKELYEAVWEKEYLHDDMNIMAHIHRIRKKMGDDTRKPRYIQNVYGIGYIMEGK